MRSVRRNQVRRNKKSRNLVFLTFSVLLFIYLSLSLVAGERSLLKYMKLRSIKARLMAETAAIENQNKDMREQVELFKKDLDHVEELAREYGMSKKGEWIYKFKDDR